MKNTTMIRVSVETRDAIKKIADTENRTIGRQVDQIVKQYRLVRSKNTPK
jgi:hypothetical protein